MDEPFYIPKYIDNILRKCGEEVDIIKIIALPPHISKKGYLETVRNFLDYFGVIVFSYMVLLRAFYRISDFIKDTLKISTRFHSVRLVCKYSNVSFARAATINHNQILSEIEGLNPDVIFSVAAPQIFGNKIISIPRKGCLNIHSSLLPKYRGLNANFWVLAKGEKRTGVTIHYINPGIDDGDILLQKEVLIESDWSLNDLYHNIMEAGSSAVAECLRLIQNDEAVASPNDISNGTYFTFPTRKDVREFRKLKKRFFKYY